VGAQDFWVQIGSGDGPGYEVALRSPNGAEVAFAVQLPLSARELEVLAARVPDAVIASSAAVRRSLSADDPVRRLGGVLFDVLLAEDGARMFAACRSQADRDGSRLRLVLQVRSPELERLPWEFLYDSRKGDYSGRPGARRSERSRRDAV
jgi:hypothetical protein